MEKKNNWSIYWNSYSSDVSLERVINKDRYYRLLKRLISLPTKYKIRIAEIGCGSGMRSLALAKEFKINKNIRIKKGTAMSNTLYNKLCNYAENDLNVLLIGTHGIGKTTLAKLISRLIGAEFLEYSAVSANKEDMKKAEEYIAKAERDSNNYNVGWSTEVSTIKAILSNGKK